MQAPGILEEAELVYGAGGGGKGKAPPRRSARARTTRYRDDFIDADFLQYVAPNDDEPMAFAEEAAAPKKSPTPKAPTSSRLEYDEPDDRSLGQDYQAAIPPLRVRWAQPTASEARFLPAAPLYAPDPSCDVGEDTAEAAAAFKAKYTAASDGAVRRQLLAAAVQRLDEQMGPELVRILNLDLLGGKCASIWRPHEELLFCLGMCDKYRMFKYIRQCYLFSRSAHELNGYYHNVWKTRSTPEADTFLSLRERRASATEMLAFVDEVRDRLTSMWDKTKMGDMPKLLKDAAAAAAADAEMQAAADSDEDNASGSFAASSENASDDSSSGHRAAARKPRPKRKRPAAAAAQAASSSQQHALVFVQPVRPGQMPAPAGLPSPTDARQLQLQPPSEAVQQQRKRQRQRRAPPQRDVPAPAAAAASRALQPAVSLSALPRYPEMPLLPEADASDAAASEAWLKALPAYRAAVTEYIQSVHSITNAAVQGYQKSIDEAQAQRTRLLSQADTYLRSLVAKGQKVMVNVNARMGQAPQQASARPTQAPPQQQPLQSQQQQPAAVQPASGDLQLAVKELLLSHAKKKKQENQQQQQQCGGSAAAGQPVVPSVQPQQPVQQQHAAADAVANSEQAAAPAALPFPSGPASKWPSSQGGSSTQAPGKTGLKPGILGSGCADAEGEGLLNGSSSEECELFVACTEATAA